MLSFKIIWEHLLRKQEIIKMYTKYHYYKNTKWYKSKRQRYVMHAHINNEALIKSFNKSAIGLRKYV